MLHQLACEVVMGREAEVEKKIKDAESQSKREAKARAKQMLADEKKTGAGAARNSLAKPLEIPSFGSSQGAPIAFAKSSLSARLPGSSRRTVRALNLPSAVMTT